MGDTLWFSEGALENFEKDFPILLSRQPRDFLSNLWNSEVIVRGENSTQEGDRAEGCNMGIEGARVTSWFECPWVLKVETSGFEIAGTSKASWWDGDVGKDVSGDMGDKGEFQPD